MEHAVGLERGSILILLIEKKLARIFRRLVADVQQTSRFFARMLLQNVNVLAAFCSVPGFTNMSTLRTIILSSHWQF